VPSEGPIGAGVASRYATAAFEIAAEEHALEALERDFSQVKALIEASPDLARLLRSPVYSRATQGRAWAALLERLAAHALTRKLIGVLARQRRLYALCDIIRCYEALMARRRGEITARVTSAAPLDAEERARLIQEIKTAFRREVKLDVSVDKRLLAGLIVRVGSRMIDASLATKLDRMTRAMKEA
jgi:F-type H+-transporting ATPase subunit delta